MTAKTKSNITAIGWYQIIGGGIGILIIAYSLFNMEAFPALDVLVYLFMLSFFIYSIFCGALCLKNTRNALRHSLINQFLQLIGFAVFGFAFMYVAGVYLSVGLDLSNSFDMNFNLGVSKFDLKINREHELAEVNFNLVAFGFIYWIDKITKKVKTEENDAAILTVGEE